VLTCERRRPALPHDAPTGELLAGLARRRPPPPCGSERPLLASYSGKPLALEDPSKKILGGCSRHGTRPPPPPPPPPPPWWPHQKISWGGVPAPARPPPPPPPRSSCGRQALQQQREEGRGRGLPDATESPPAGSLFQGENVCVCLCQRGCLLPFPRPNPSDPSITARRPSRQMSTHHTISLSVVAFPPTSQPHAHLSSPKSPWVLCTCPTHSGLLQQSLWVWGSPSLASHRHHHSRLHSDAMLLATARSIERHAARRAPCHTATER
jgi:hypothetical protein